MSREAVSLAESEWRARLSAEQYRVLRQKGTEPPFSGELTDEHAAGAYTCAGCGAPLFTSQEKFDSHCGWPSFTAPVEGEALHEHEDLSHNMHRVEVTCANCGGHLGHVFPDGPRPTGLRYCINSVSLTFQPETKK